MIVPCSRLITSPDEAIEYYRVRLVGDHNVTTLGVTITVRFNREEIHLFTEAIDPGRKPDPSKLVRRPGDREERVFSLRRARLLDQIIPAIERPAKCLRAKIAGGVQLIGPVDASGERLSVVLGPDRVVWFVRTSYVLTAADYRRQLRSTPAPWPPNNKDPR